MRTAFFATCLMIFAADAKATHLYEFVQTGTNDTLAYWELSSLPAGYDEVVSLTFTPQGEAIFGLGEVYAGEFDHWANNTASDDGMGGLGDDEDNLFGAWTFDQDDVPVSSLVIDPIGQRLYLGYMNDPGLDSILYKYQDSADGPGELMTYGDWRQVSVPEPSSVTLALLGMASACLRRHRQRATAEFT